MPYHDLSFVLAGRVFAGCTLCYHPKVSLAEQQALGCQRCACDDWKLTYRVGYL